MQLASRFAPRSPVLRSETPLSDDQIRAVAPSIFAEAPHGSRDDQADALAQALLFFGDGGGGVVTVPGGVVDRPGVARVVGSGRVRHRPAPGVVPVGVRVRRGPGSQHAR